MNHFKLHDDIRQSDFQHQWEMIEMAVKHQKDARNDSLQRKIHKINSIIHNNQESDQIKDQLIEQKLNLAEQTLSIVDINKYENICEQFYQNVQKSFASVLLSSDQSMKELANKNKQNLRKEIDQIEMTNFTSSDKVQKSIKNTLSQSSQLELFVKESLNKIKKNHEKKLFSLNEEILTQINTFSENLHQFKKIREENELKLTFMIEEMQSQVEKIIEGQQREGIVSYDCLLKLLEDSCLHLQQAMIR